MSYDDEKDEVYMNPEDESVSEQEFEEFEEREEMEDEILKSETFDADYSIPAAQPTNSEGKKLKIKIKTKPKKSASQTKAEKVAASTKKKPPRFKRERRRVNSLRPHPRQAELTPTTEREDERLRQDLQDNGQRDPIEITSDGTIISGHRRWLAAKTLEWQNITVVVRHDLEKKGDDAVDYRFYEANCSRRNLSTLQQARLAYRMHELMPKGRKRRGQGSVREALQQQFDRSGRQLERLMPLVVGPVELFQAVERKQLPAKRALEALTKLKEKQLREAVERLKKGDSPKAVVDAYLPREPRRKSTPLKPKELHDVLALCEKHLDGDMQQLRQTCKKDPALHGSLERVRERLEAFFNERSQSKSATKGGLRRSKPR